MQQANARPINVFLVDDHRTVLWGLERLIDSAAPQMCVVGMAQNCDEMFEKLPQSQADLILLDLDLDGISSLGRLDEITTRSTARVLILTGNRDPAVHQHAVVHGARGVVHKQVEADSLLRAIQKVHEGEIWLDRQTLGGVLTALSKGEIKSDAATLLESLTRKERQVVQAVVDEKGARIKVMADKLNMSEHTMRNHLTVIYEKLKVSGRMELYLFAVGETNARIASC